MRAAALLSPGPALWSCFSAGEWIFDGSWPWLILGSPAPGAAGCSAPRGRVARTCDGRHVSGSAPPAAINGMCAHCRSTALGGDTGEGFVSAPGRPRGLVASACPPGMGAAGCSGGRNGAGGGGGGARGGKRAPRSCGSSFLRGFASWGDPTAPRPAPSLSLSARRGRPAWRLPGLH